MKILYLSHRIPYPPNKGDKIRSFNEIKYLSQWHRIDLACLADNPDDLKYQKDLEAYCRLVHIEPHGKLMSKIRGIHSLLIGRSISSGYFFNRTLQRIVSQWLSETAYDAILCFSSPMAEYIFRLPASQRFSTPVSTPSRLFMDFCDVDSDKWRQYGRQSTLPMNIVYQTEFCRLQAYEQKINQTFNSSIFVSQKEANLFKTLYPKARNLAVIPNGVDSDYFNPSAPASHHPNLLFAGAMDYHANIDGVRWFHKEIFPQLLKADSRLSFTIVGSNPTPSVKALAKLKNTKVTGYVEDIRPYYEAADICIIPLRLARGVQNKVLEAMAMEKAIVTTSAAIQGISAVNGQHLLVADTAEDFIQAADGLLKNPDKRKKLGISARAFVTQHYSWANHMGQLNELLSASDYIPFAQCADTSDDLRC